ncbi:hypothetical protein [Staphylococcus epidermidis]
MNDGEAVFTERYYSEEAPELWVSSEEVINIETSVYELEHQAIQFD